jgi:hypothetical protein
MSSVAMALKTRGSNLDPGSYDVWLTNNGQGHNTRIQHSEQEQRSAFNA